MEDYLMGRTTLEKLSPEMATNANETVNKANALLDAFGHFRKCNSGYRRYTDQAMINPKAPNSLHTKCAAIDLEDADGELWKWCMEHMDYLVFNNLYLEDKTATPHWVHVQIYPPHSGARIFKP